MTPSPLNQNTMKYRGSLHIHVPHPHISRNANDRHKGEQAQSNFNQRIAVAITRGLGTMWAAYIFAALAIYGFPGLAATPTQYVQWLSQTFIQLVALSVLAVGQAILGRKAEIQADEAYKATLNSYHDIEQVMEHLAAQDAELLKQTTMLAQLLRDKENDNAN